MRRKKQKEVYKYDDYIMERAHAKINICLDVERKRADGYHLLNSIVVPLSLYDQITLQRTEEMSYQCNDDSLVFDSSNTIVKAVELMKNTFDIKDNYRINVTKNIPMEAGLGGGSSDAAAIIRAIFYLNKLPVDFSYLEEIGLQIGADVPCLIRNNCVHVTGIGENLEFIKNHFRFPVLLVKPNAGASTKQVYENLNLKTCPHPDVQKCLEEWQNGNFDGVLANCGNSLEESTFQLVKEVADLKEELKSYGFQFVSMTGSGTTMFAVGGMDIKGMYPIAEKLRERYPFAVVTSSYGSLLEPVL